VAAAEATVAEHTFAGMTCAEAADLAPAFVLGALEATESAAVRRHLAECPELHAEMAELHSVVPALFEAVEPVAPPAGLRDRILAAAAADLEARRPVQAPPAAQPVREPVLAPRRGFDLGAVFRRPVWAAVAAAGLVVAVALGAWNIQLNQQIASLRDQVSGLTAYRDGVVQVLDKAAEPGAQLAILAPPEGEGPSGLAAWGEDGTVAIVMRDLAPTTGTQVYEAWLIAGDGAPIPIGGFKVGADGTGTFGTNHVPLGEGTLIALTLEPQEGATAPTLPIIAAGATRAQSS
jgi:anti-sigma-K factor RskA